MVASSLAGLSVSMFLGFAAISEQYLVLRMRSSKAAFPHGILMPLLCRRGYDLLESTTLPLVVQLVLQGP